MSLERAEQTGLWHRASDGSELERLAPPADPVYDPIAIKAAYAQLVGDSARWDAWFTRNRITPLRIDYAQLSADPIGTLRSILRFLGRDPDAASCIRVGTDRLSDATSADWIARFRAEHGQT